MSAQVFTPRPSASRAIVIAHFDGHGVATGAVLCRSLQCRQTIAKFPETGPQRLAQFIQALDLYKAYVHIVDIPINVAAPKEHIAALETAAEQAEKVVIWDHHDTDLKYVAEFQRVELRYFSTATDMARAIAGLTDDPRNHELLYIGVIADRDANILQIIDRETVERRLLPLANALDVLVRRDAQTTAGALTEYGLDWLEREARGVDYPPARLWRRLEVRERGARALLLAPVDTTQNRELEGWLPKTLEMLLLNTGYDYAVIPTQQLDRRTGQPFWSVRVLKYWLSSAPTVSSIVRPLAEGRQIVGHEDYLSIRAVDRTDAEQLARRIYQELERPASRAARLINEQLVAQSIQYDYARIIQLLERIAGALERGAEEKARQVRLLEQLYERDERTRYD